MDPSRDGKRDENSVSTASRSATVADPTTARRHHRSRAGEAACGWAWAALALHSASNMRLADFLSRSRSCCLCASIGLAAACTESRHHAVTDQVLIASLRTADFATRDLVVGNTSLANVWSAATAATLATALPSVGASDDDDDRRRASTASRDTTPSTPRVNASANVVTPPSPSVVSRPEFSASSANDIDGGAGTSSGSSLPPAAPAALPSPPSPAVAAPSQTASPDGDASRPPEPQAWPGPGPFIFVPTFPVPTPPPAASPEGGAP